RALAPQAECFRALVHALQGRYDDAIDRAERAGEESERGGFVGSLAWSLWVRLVAQRWAGRALDASLIDEVDGLMGAFGLAWGVAWAHATRAECALAAGDVVTARRVSDEALALAEQRPFAGYARSHCLLVCASVRRAVDD